MTRSSRPASASTRGRSSETALTTSCSVPVEQCSGDDLVDGDRLEVDG